VRALDAINAYDFRGQSDPLRVRASRLGSLAVDPRDENRISAVCTDGTVMLFQAGTPRASPWRADPLGTSMTALRASQPLLLRGCLSAAKPATCVAQGPADADGTVPLMALGTASGTVQLLNLRHAALQAQYVIHSAPLTDLAWVGPDKLVVLAT
jgi:hypothetical protein